MQFFNEYSKNVSEYMESVDLDLTSDLEVRFKAACVLSIVSLMLV
jgi:hypothetical protein